MSAFLRKYNVASDVYVPIVKRAVVDFAIGADWTPAAGDVKVSIDGGAAANIATLPTAIAMGNTAKWKFPLSAAELLGKKISVTVADAAAKAVEDQMFVIETYGHASAEHPFDLGTASVAQTGDSFARIGAPAGASVSADIAAIEAQTDDIGAAGAGLTAADDAILAILGTPAGASMSADIAAVKTQTAAIETDTQDIQARLPAALTVDGNIKADTLRVGGTLQTAGDIIGDTNDIQARLPAALVGGRIDASVGAMAADVLTAAALAADAAAEIADAFLDRDMSTGTDSGSATVRTPRQAMRALRNKWSISGTTMTVTKEDDTTTSWTTELTKDAAADPITGSDPASA